MSDAKNREPQPPSPIAHIVDLVVFRLAGAAILFHEIGQDSKADWHVMVAGFAMFFMPDALRGKSSIVFRTIEKVVSKDDDA